MEKVSDDSVASVEVSKEDKKPEGNSVDEKQEVTEEKSENEVTNGKKEELPSLLEKIKKQVEFYFGDVNMQKDKFLNEQTKLDEGWVPMTVMLNFKMLASLSKDIDTILKSLEDSELIEISEDRKKIRRSLNVPLPTYNEEYRKSQEAKTIYLKGFPLDSTMDSLKKFLEPYNSVENIIMRKYKKDKEFFFKGSIFVQFKTLEDAKLFMENESIKHGDTELIKMWSADYTVSKEKEKEERRQKKSGNKNNKSENKAATKNNKNNTENNVILPKGCVIRITKLDKTLKREQIKEKFIELGAPVAFIDHNLGDTEGYIRLQGENSAVEFLETLKSETVKVEDCDIACKLLEGEEEEAFLQKTQEDIANLRNKRSGGRGGRRGTKRRHSPNRESAKKAALE